MNALLLQKPCLMCVCVCVYILLNKSASVQHPATGVSSFSKWNTATKQKPDLLQREEGEEEDCKIGSLQVHEAALWPLDQTQGWIQKEAVEEETCPT